MKKKKSIKFRYGINAAFLTVMFIAAIILVNLVTGVVSDKFPSINIDLSENKQFALSDETKNAVSEIDKEIKITVVLYSDETDPYYDELIARYKECSPLISSAYVNPQKNPSQVNKYSDDINPNGTFIIECGERYEILDCVLIDGANGRMADAESLMTNAIMSVISDEKKYVSFTNGHGESDFSGLKRIYENKYFEVSDIDLKLANAKKCDMIVICAPTQDFTQQELAYIDSLSKNGTKLQIFLNPQAQFLPNLYEYISEWGVQVKNEIVKENNKSYIYSDYYSYISLVKDSLYTKNISNSYPLLYEPAYRLDIQYSGTKNVTVTELLTSTEAATTVSGETENTDTKEYLIAAVSKRINENDSYSYMFVSGSSLNLKYDYNSISGLPANKQLANSVISGLLGEDNLVEIPSKPSDLQAFGLSKTQSVLVVISVILVAAALIICGFVIWRKRRFL